MLAVFAEDLIGLENDILHGGPSMMFQTLCNRNSRNIVYPLLLVLSTIIAPVVSEAGSFDDCLVAYEKGDFVTAAKCSRIEADQGDIFAQNLLGLMYEKGEGVTQDYAQAVKWYQKAADQGSAGAQSDLGFMYVKGLGVTQDYTQANKWFLKAANQGDTRAQTNLGVMYKQGVGVDQNYEQAVEWFQKAADQGDALAQNLLGFMYVKGHGVTQDYAQAHKWFNLAAAKGHLDAAKSRDLVAQLMTLAQIAEAQKLAHEWKPKTP